MRDGGTKPKGKPRKKRLASMEPKTSFNMAVSVHAKDQLKRLASFFGITQRAMIETILEKSEQEALRQVGSHLLERYSSASEPGAGRIEYFFPDPYHYERHKALAEFMPDRALLERIKTLVNKDRAACIVHDMDTGKKEYHLAPAGHISFVYDKQNDDKPTCYLFDMFREHNGGSVRRIVLGTIQTWWEGGYRIYGLMGGMEQRVVLSITDDISIKRLNEVGWERWQVHESNSCYPEDWPDWQKI